MTNPRLIRVCATCGQEWAGIYVLQYHQCEACAGVDSIFASPEGADWIATNFQDDLKTYEARMKETP